MKKPIPYWMLSRFSFAQISTQYMPPLQGAADRWRRSRGAALAWHVGVEGGVVK